jgi:hypothetical protein
MAPRYGVARRLANIAAQRVKKPTGSVHLAVNMAGKPLEWPRNSVGSRTNTDK